MDNILIFNISLVYACVNFLVKVINATSVYHSDLESTYIKEESFEKENLVVVSTTILYDPFKVS